MSIEKTILADSRNSGEWADADIGEYSCSCSKCNGACPEMVLTKGGTCYDCAHNEHAK